ncbi:hypothetical protein [Stomatohabitans albus]|uniref:hypothetical protein n=1 Tax=Stomatohabitans albus TaxID=3110766 RepID=UPI00300DA015
MTEHWGFAHDPDTDLGEPVSTPSEDTDGPGNQAEDTDNGSTTKRSRLGLPQSPQLLPTRRFAARPGLWICLITLSVWLILAFVLAIGGQHALGIPVDWRLGLVLAAVSPGGGLDIQTEHWALSLTTGPILPGIVILGVWAIGWSVAFSDEYRRTNAPIQTPMITKAALLGAGLHLGIVLVAFLIGSMITVSGQPVWIRPTLVSTLWGATAFPTITLLVGLYYSQVLPSAIKPAISRCIMWLTLLGLGIGVLIVAQSAVYGMHWVVLILCSPLALLFGLSLTTGAPLVLQLLDGQQPLHASWGLGGVQGTVSVPIVLPIAAGGFILGAIIVAHGVRQAIQLGNSRRQGLWVIAATSIVLCASVLFGQVSIANLVTGTTPPPVVPTVAQALHNGMTVQDGGLWSLTLAVSWPVAMATMAGLLTVSYGIGVILAGTPQATHQDQTLETSLQTVYAAGLIDETAYARARYALHQSANRRIQAPLGRKSNRNPTSR